MTSGNNQGRRSLAILSALLAAVLLAALGGPARAAGEVNPLLTDEAIDSRIQKLRTAEATLTVTDADGKPLANAEVVVTMQRHKFLFGGEFFDWDRIKDPQLQEAYRARFAELFNFATLPFYWNSYEPEEGRTDAARLRAMAEWCRDHGLRTKGHPLVYHLVPPKWVANLDMATLRRLQLARVTREVATFAGLIDTWDVVNEPTMMADAAPAEYRLDKAMTAKELVAAAFAAARAANPKANLILNEAKHDEDFILFAQQCLDARMPIDLIGIQTHMFPGYIGAQRTWNIAQEFVPIGRPQHWTEITITSGKPKTWHGFDYVKDWPTSPEGEERQAKEVAEFYRVLFSHPAVEAATWWDFSDLHTWIGAPAGLLHKDMTPKPAYNALKKLIKGQWWTGPLKLTTDAQGRVSFRGFLGDYEVRAGAAVGQFSLDGATKLNVAAKVATPAKP